MTYITYCITMINIIHDVLFCFFSLRHFGHLSHSYVKTRPYSIHSLANIFKYSD